MTFRPGPLRAAAALAVGFVVVRVVYRVLFHGAEGSGAVLLPLPSWRMPAPFAHVVLLGPVTTDGLADAALGALPIALTILAFGVLNSLVDLPRLFVRGARRGPLSGLARALAIAWATLPSLADAARAVRFAQRLRGERGGVRLLAPLLQRTLERAGNVAAALELRGFAGRGLGGECREPVTATELQLGFREASRDAAGAGFREGSRDGVAGGLRVGSLALPHGSLTLVSGPTGSGKSTLLRAIAGLHTHTDGEWMSGTLRVAGHDRATVPPRDLARVVGVVLQHPRDAFATERVRDEIGLALELRGVAAVVLAARVAEVADRVGVTALLDRPTRGLSAGEATLVAIAAAIIEHPILLLVDEPLADLDADARVRVAVLLDALAHEAGICVVVAEHRTASLEPFADHGLRIDGGEVRTDAARDTRAGVEISAEIDPSTPSRGRYDEYPPTSSRAAAESTVDARGEIAPGAPETGAARRFGLPLPPHGAAPGRVALRAEAVTVRHGGVLAVDAASIALRAGEFVALVGPNGAGKSSLLAALALPARGTSVEAPGRVALVPDASDDLFVYDTVAAECARADRRGVAGRTASRFAGFLGLDPDGPEFAARRAQHPRDLSVGERRCLALAVQLAGEPAVLMVDEPTRGLDPAARDLVVAALTSLAAGGATVLVASHEPDLAGRADRVLRMESGVVSPAPAYPTQGAAAPARRGGARHTVRAAAGPESGTSTGRHRSGGIPAVSPARREAHRPTDGARRLRLPRPATLALLAANLVALGAFCWPLVASAVPEQAEAAVPIVALALAPLAALVAIATLDGTVRSAHMLALLGTLAAIGAAVRIASTGVGGVEAVFILLILAGRAFGARFALLLGMATIALSSVLWGAIGPWSPFQMFACAWVGAVAGLLPRVRSPRLEIAMLCGYGVLASYAFGLLMNLWFWPFAVGVGTDISYEGGAPIGLNLSNFLLYSLVTSTLSWDTLRAVTTVVGLVVVGRPILSALRRAKPLAPEASVTVSPSRTPIGAR